MANSYSEKFDLRKENELKSKLEAGGFVFKPFDHALWRAQGENVNVTLYKSAKLLVQGKGTDDFLVKYLNQTVQQGLSINVPSKSADNTTHNFKSWIGTDESGKGDYFGPLIIAGVHVDENNMQKMLEIGVQDSKKLKDAQIEKMAAKIKANSVFSIVAINPSRYNELYLKFNNLNKLLAWGHARAIENILEKQNCENAISDKFGDESLIKNALLNKGRNINLIQRVRAESDAAVAAASILARAEYVKRMDALSSKFEIELPKGASARVAQQANKFIAKYDITRLGEVAKLHFKTTKTLVKQ